MCQIWKQYYGSGRVRIIKDPESGKQSNMSHVVKINNSTKWVGVWNLVIIKLLTAMLASTLLHANAWCLLHSIEYTSRINELWYDIVLTQ